MKLVLHKCQIILLSIALFFSTLNIYAADAPSSISMENLIKEFKKNTNIFLIYSNQIADKFSKNTLTKEEYSNIAQILSIIHDLLYKIIMTKAPTKDLNAEKLLALTNYIELIYLPEPNTFRNDYLKNLLQQTVQEFEAGLLNHQNFAFYDLLRTGSLKLEPNLQMYNNLYKKLLEEGVSIDFNDAFKWFIGKYKLTEAATNGILSLHGKDNIAAANYVASNTSLMRIVIDFIEKHHGRDNSSLGINIHNLNDEFILKKWILKDFIIRHSDDNNFSLIDLSANAIIDSLYDINQFPEINSKENLYILQNELFTYLITSQQSLRDSADIQDKLEEFLKNKAIKNDVNIRKILLDFSLLKNDHSLRINQSNIITTTYKKNNAILIDTLSNDFVKLLFDFIKEHHNDENTSLDISIKALLDKEELDTKNLIFKNFIANHSNSEDFSIINLAINAVIDSLATINSSFFDTPSELDLNDAVIAYIIYNYYGIILQLEQGIRPVYSLVKGHIPNTFSHIDKTLQYQFDTKFKPEINNLKIKIADIGILEQFNFYLKKNNSNDTSGILEFNEIFKSNSSLNFLLSFGDVRLTMEGVRNKLKSEALFNISIYNTLEQLDIPELSISATEIIPELQNSSIDNRNNFIDRFIGYLTDVEFNQIFIDDINYGKNDPNYTPFNTDIPKYHHSNKDRLKYTENNTTNIIERYNNLTSNLKSGNVSNIKFNDTDDFKYIYEHLLSEEAKENILNYGLREEGLSFNNDPSSESNKIAQLFAYNTRMVNTITGKSDGTLIPALVYNGRVATATEKNYDSHDYLNSNYILDLPTGVMKELERNKVDINLNELAPELKEYISNIKYIKEDILKREKLKLPPKNRIKISEYDYIKTLFENDATSTTVSGFVYQRLAYLLAEDTYWQQTYTDIPNKYQDTIANSKDSDLIQNLNNIDQEKRRIDVVIRMQRKIARYFGVHRPLQINMANNILRKKDKIAITKAMINSYDIATHYLLSANIDTKEGKRPLYELIYGLSNENLNQKTRDKLLISGDNSELYSKLLALAAIDKKSTFYEHIKEIENIDLDDSENAYENFKKVFYITDGLYGSIFTQDQLYQIFQLSSSSNGFLYNVISTVAHIVGFMMLGSIMTSTVFLGIPAMIAATVRGGVLVNYLITIGEGSMGIFTDQKMYNYIEKYRQNFEIISSNRTEHLVSKSRYLFFIIGLTYQVVLFAWMFTGFYRDVSRLAKNVRNIWSLPRDFYNLDPVTQKEIITGITTESNMTSRLPYDIKSYEKSVQLNTRPKTMFSAPSSTPEIIKADSIGLTKRFSNWYKNFFSSSKHKLPSKNIDTKNIMIKEGGITEQYQHIIGETFKYGQGDVEVSRQMISTFTEHTPLFYVDTYGRSLLRYLKNFKIPTIPNTATSASIPSSANAGNSFFRRLFSPKSFLDKMVHLAKDTREAGLKANQSYSEFLPKFEITRSNFFKTKDAFKGQTLISKIKLIPDYIVKGGRYFYDTNRMNFKVWNMQRFQNRGIRLSNLMKQNEILKEIKNAETTRAMADLTNANIKDLAAFFAYNPLTIRESLRGSIKLFSGYSIFEPLIIRNLGPAFLTTPQVYLRSMSQSYLGLSYFTVHPYLRQRPNPYHQAMLIQEMDKLTKIHNDNLQKMTVITPKYDLVTKTWTNVTDKSHLDQIINPGDSDKIITQKILNLIHNRSIIFSLKKPHPALPYNSVIEVKTIEKMLMILQQKTTDPALRIVLDNYHKYLRKTLKDPVNKPYLFNEFYLNTQSDAELFSDYTSN